MDPRIDDILQEVRTIRKALFGNGSGVGLMEDVRVITRILDDHITDHTDRGNAARAIRNGVATRVLNVAERAVPWGLLIGLLVSR